MARVAPEELRPWQPATQYLQGVAEGATMPKLPPIPGVYYIRCKVTNKRYIGSATGCVYRRKKQHWKSLQEGTHYNRLLQRAWNKYGEGAFEFDWIEMCEPGDCLKREQHWMDYYQSYNRQKGYNLSPTAGSNLGRVFPPGVRANMAKSQMGKKLSAEHRAKISAGGRGQKRSAETRARISAAIKAAHARGEPFFRGRKHSEETKKKMSASAKRYLAQQKDPTTGSEEAPVITSVAGT